MQKEGHVKNLSPPTKGGMGAAVRQGPYLEVEAGDGGGGGGGRGGGPL